MSLKLMSAIDSSRNVQKVNEAEKLLKQLLECVQECQRRFGGKTELATEFDSCVAAICVCFESVFLYGLRSKLQSTIDQNSSSLKQVSDILVHTLSIGNEGSSFWPFIKKHLTKHEQERYTGLKQIWTDTGRGRAWLRSALNERSLERYCHILLSNADILNEHYESWSILRDDEKNSMLPNMAAGLNSILFAVSIDKPELNSGVTPRPEVHKSKVEPIIDAPMPETKEKSKERIKRKVARQFISFDDDDSSLSNGIPSSSSSTASDNTSLGGSTSSRDKSKAYLNQIDEEKLRSLRQMEQDQEVKQRRPNIIRKISIENSGTRDKYSMVLPDSLRPVTQSEIGELTPVSVEINTNFVSPESSNDIIEVPADISALLTSVETKNKKDIEMKEEKILLLKKENDGLKEQVKKYMSAIQMLRSDNEGIGELLEGLNVELQPDYKGEAKLFERKLVQVAEMHAELMDFNVMLQQNLIMKESLIDKLRNEIEVLGGPVSLDEIGSESMGSVNVWIPSAFLTGTGSNSHHVYQIFLRAGQDEWNIYRRYAQFHALHTDLRKLDSAVGTFDFPPKKRIGKKDSSLVEDRRKRLQIYLRKVIAHWPELAHCNNRFLLEQHLSFFKVKNRYPEYGYYYTTDEVARRTGRPISRQTSP